MPELLTPMVAELGRLAWRAKLGLACTRNSSVIESETTNEDGASADWLVKSGVSIVIGLGISFLRFI